MLSFGLQPLDILLLLFVLPLLLLPARIIQNLVNDFILLSLLLLLKDLPPSLLFLLFDKDVFLLYICPFFPRFSVWELDQV